jgi:phosphocarrier protein HPr
MLETKLKIINQLGLHARAAAQLVKLSSSYKSSIKLQRTDSQIVADAKSILSILTLAASRGTIISIKIEGSDEIQALENIQKLFESGFGEI